MPKPSRTSTSEAASAGYSRFATAKAAAVTVFFLVLGAIVALQSGASFRVLLPYLVIHGFILVNTYPSIRLFSSIGPRGDARQGAADAAIVALYLWMTFALGDPVWYAFSSSAMFAAAALKYTLMLGTVPHTAVLRRKVIMDLVGCLCALGALVGCLLGDAYVSLHLWGIAFAVAQIDVFIAHPLYPRVAHA